MKKFTVVSHDDNEQVPCVDHVEAKNAEDAALHVAKARANEDVGIVAVFEGHLQDQLGATSIQWGTSLLEAYSE